MYQRLRNPGVQPSSSSGWGGHATHLCGIVFFFIDEFKPSNKYLYTSKWGHLIKVNKQNLIRTKGGSQLGIMLTRMIQRMQVFCRLECIVQK